MTLPERESRLQEAAPESPAKATVSMVDDAADLSAYVDTYGVVVETTDLKHRRRVFLSLHSAEKAAGRARAAGHRAELFLIRMTPVIGGEAR